MLLSRLKLLERYIYIYIYIFFFFLVKSNLLTMFIKHGSSLAYLFDKYLFRAYWVAGTVMYKWFLFVWE